MFRSFGVIPEVCKSFCQSETSKTVTSTRSEAMTVSDLVQFVFINDICSIYSNLFTSWLVPLTNTFALDIKVGAVHNG